MLKTYRHNIPRGYLNFEATSTDAKNQYLLALESDGEPWLPLIVISADEQEVRYVRLKIDLSDPKNPVTIDSLD